MQNQAINLKPPKIEAVVNVNQAFQANSADSFFKRRTCMPVLETKQNARTAVFQANMAAMQTLANHLRSKVAKSAAGGGEVARAKHVARVKLPPSERLPAVAKTGQQSCRCHLRQWTPPTALSAAPAWSSHHRRPSPQTLRPLPGGLRGSSQCGLMARL